MATSTKWKNTKEKSYYNRQGKFGFIYKVVEDKSEPTKEQVVSSIDPEHVELELEEEVRDEIEVELFLSEIRKGLVAAGSTRSEEELDEIFKHLTEDLLKDHLYKRCLEEKENTESEDKELKEYREGLLQFTEKCKRESEQWATVCEERRQVAEQAKEGYAREKYLNFLKLPPRDVAPLKSFLTPEQLSLIETEVSTEFVSSATHDLDSLEERLDQELARLSSLGETNKDSNIADQSVLNCTPRKVFGDMKDFG